jgi:hypothetical protein
MYREHPVLHTPSAKTKLWRYLDLYQFLWLLPHGCLYFASLTEFEDKWEGTPLAVMIEAAYTEWMSMEWRAVHVLEPETVDVIKSTVKYLHGSLGVSCWHKNDAESVAMWALYAHGKDGVAIQTTVERLKACFSSEARDIFIGKVKYRDHALIDKKSMTPDPIFAMVVKRRSFRHEPEVRLILDKTGRVDNKTVTTDLSKLIQGIVTSPTYPEWALADLQKRVDDAGLKIRVRKSDILTLPEEPRIPHVGGANSPEL